MATADVKLTLSPSEFDLVRRALKGHGGERLAFADTFADKPEGTPSERRDARAEAAQAFDLHRKLNG